MTSTLFSLPRELRDRIFEFVVYSQSRYDEVNVEELQQLQEYPSPFSKSSDVKTYHFLSTHPQIYTEALPLVIATHPLIITSLNQLQQALDSSNLSLKNHCTHLILSCKSWTGDEILGAIELVYPLLALQHLEQRLYSMNENTFVHSTPFTRHSFACPTHTFPSLTTWTVRDVVHEVEERYSKQRAVIEGRRELEIRGRALRGFNEKLEKTCKLRIRGRREGVCCCEGGIEVLREWEKGVAEDEKRMEGKGDGKVG